MPDRVSFKSYAGPAGGWGSAKSLIETLSREQVLVKGTVALMHQNKPSGFACVSCSYAKSGHRKVFDFCDNGAKATAWEITEKRTGPEFFAQHTLTELECWSDHSLEDHGRLTTPMRWESASDKYVPVSWADAFAEIGRELQVFDPKSVVLYASGRASLEASYLYQLFARMLGSNNLPDSSNMCHESTSVALPETIGVPIGTVKLDDFDKTDCILFFGQNAGTNSPRMLHQLQDARRRSAEIITFNPLRERGLERFTNPQEPLAMMTGGETQLSTQYHQVRAGGDLAAIMGLCKALFASDDAARASGAERVLDMPFIEQHTSGLEQLAEAARSHDWRVIERCSGLSQTAMEAAATTYAASKTAIACYGMGLTQHRSGVENVQMVSNLLLLRGNIGKPGAGICPVRGHSNVQGQRTVGITEKPDMVPNDRLTNQYGFAPPLEPGMNTVEACQGMLNGKVLAFVGLGGNFIRAVPETEAMEKAWRKLRLTVQIATKLNRNHIIHGQIAFLLPCLGRTEIDRQNGIPQIVTVEDTTGTFHRSTGQIEPASNDLLSEPKIIAGIAAATLAKNEKMDWSNVTNNYARVRDAIAETYPDIFANFNTRLKSDSGFDRPNPARDRVWKTASGKATFMTPGSLAEDPDLPAFGPGVLMLMTIRSHDQFNTTVYGLDDRLRGIRGTRRVVLMNEQDATRMSCGDGEVISLQSAAGDGVHREVTGLRIVYYDIPCGCCAGYYPECNPLLPLWHHASRSKVPAAKSIPVRVVKKYCEESYDSFRKESR
jgi:molybdopterin-dependent oxidoreductase alpha subunit